MFEINSWGEFVVTAIFLLITLFVVAMWVKRETAKERRETAKEREEIKKAVKNALEEYMKENR